MNQAGIRKKSLLRTYITIVTFVCILIFLSFTITCIIINDWYRREAEQSAKARFDQAWENAVTLENDIGNLYSTVTSGEAVAAYLKAEGLAERTKLLPDFYQLIGSVMKINPNVKAMMLYDEEGELVATRGTKFFPRQEIPEIKGMYGFSGQIPDLESGEIYFEVEMPVYGRESTGMYDQLGSAILLLDAQGFEKIVDTVSLNEDTYTAVRDGNGKTLAQAGKWQEEYTDFIQVAGDSKKCLVYRKQLEMSGWELVNIIPRKSFMSYVNQIQVINLFTYGVVALTLVEICVMIYKKVIGPIHRQMEFIKNYTQDTQQRIKVLEKNEFGELAEKFNEMLDGLEVLNRQIVDGEKKYLELEYAKKQTEMIAYKEQINPHFMYNTLECIRGMALYHEEKEIARLTGSLSKLFRYNVKGEELVTVREVIKNLKEYALIIDYRFMGKFEIKLEAENELLAVTLPKMLIQPLVENAVIHGLEPRTQKGCVKVRFRDTDTEFMEITVTDNGCGMEEEALERLREQIRGYDGDRALTAAHSGIGIANVYRRIRLFYGDSAAFDIDSVKGKGTRVSVRLKKKVGE